MNDPAYESKVNEYKNTDVLYIDDLFKCKQNGTDEITNADIKLAFELTDYRARNGMITIISSNSNIEEIINADEALGSRIFDMSGEYCMV